MRDQDLDFLIRDAQDILAAPTPATRVKGVYQPNLRSAAFRSQSTGQPTELAEQFGLVQWLRLTHPTVKFFAVPNGGKRDHTEATLKLLEGLSRGVPDLWVPHARKGYHGLVLELKVATGAEDSVWSFTGHGGWAGQESPVTTWRKGVVSPDQRKWLDHLTAEGYLSVVCEGMQMATRAVDWYFKQEVEK